MMLEKRDVRAENADVNRARKRFSEEWLKTSFSQEIAPQDGRRVITKLSASACVPLKTLYTLVFSENLQF